MPKATTKTRQELRARFASHAIPTEADFADLIAAGLNQADDGLLKLADQSLGLVRRKPTAPVLRLFGDPEAEGAAWQLQLIGTASPAFGLAGPTGVTSLLLDGTSGNLAIGTTDASHKLTVEGNWPDSQAPGSELSKQGLLAIRSEVPQLDFIDMDHTATDWAIQVRNNKLSFIRSPWEHKDLVLDGSGNVGIGTSDPGQRLTVEGTWPDAQASGSDLAKAGILAIRSNQPQLDFIDTDANGKDWAIHVNEGKLSILSSPRDNYLVLESMPPDNKKRVRVWGDLLVDGQIEATGSAIRRVWAATGQQKVVMGNSDGEIAHRRLTVNKLFDDTALRITYYDNFHIVWEVRGEGRHGSWGRWRILINGSDPTGDNPQLTMVRYHEIGSQITSGTLVGYAKGFPKGRHVITVKVERGNANYIENGYENQTWTLEAEEVRMANG